MTSVATANLLYTLPRADAGRALEAVLAEKPDLVGLQEWYVTRLPLLRRTGTVRLVAPLGLPGIPVPSAGAPRYHWVTTLADGNAVGARADRFDLVQGRSLLIDPIGRGDRDDRFLHTEPPRYVAVGVFRERSTGTTYAMISYHLTPHVENHGEYRSDLPLLVARHQREVRALAALVAELQAQGHVTYAVGDANFDRQKLAGVTSSWAGREQDPGTWGTGLRKLDDVQGPGPATSVRLVETGSDHRAVVAARD
ncbi:MAG: hypothetical protein JWQ74_1811 [Marmoricola sp.]|nr:hypothetical protein [Marmoricola sp.]